MGRQQRRHRYAAFGDEIICVYCLRSNPCGGSEPAPNCSLGEPLETIPTTEWESWAKSLSEALPFGTLSQIFSAVRDCKPVQICECGVILIGQEYDARAHRKGEHEVGPHVFRLAYQRIGGEP